MQTLMLRIFDSCYSNDAKQINTPCGDFYPQYFRNIILYAVYHLQKVIYKKGEDPLR